MKPSHRLVAVLLLSLGLAGCSSLLNVQRTPFTVYAPQYVVPAAAVGAVGAQVDWQLVVETPLGSNTLDTARVLVMPQPGVLEVFPAARWRDPAPAMLRSLVVEAFEQSRRIIGVGSAESGMRADFALAIELRDFQLEVRDGAPHAVVRFQARLVDYASNRVLIAQPFGADALAAGADAPSAFAAFETALNKILPELVDWTLREGNRAHATAPPG